MFDFNKYQNKQPFASWSRVMNPLVCMDGFTISVQASQTHYCSPREDGMSHYISVECGFPSEVVPELLPYMEELDPDPRGNVYGWVPVELVNNLINAHGGLREEDAEVLDEETVKKIEAVVNLLNKAEKEIRGIPEKTSGEP